MNTSPTEYIRDDSSSGRNVQSAQSPGLPTGESTFLARLARGDEVAFAELVNQHHGALIRTAMGYVANREVAEEVVQDTWIAVIENLHRFEGRSSLRTWIFGILIHKAKDRGVREKRHTTFSAFEFDDGSEEAVDPCRFQQFVEWTDHWAFPSQLWDDQTPEKLLASQQAVNAMNTAIGALSVSLKKVLILRDVEGVDTKEACTLLQISETNLYVRLHRARERVRALVEPYRETRKKMT